MPTRSRRFGLALLLMALVYWAAVVLRPPALETTYRTLGPWPDGPEYVDAAIHVLDGEGLRIHVAGQQLPPRYPPGYSLTLAAAIALGAPPVWAPRLVNAAGSLVLLGLAFGFFALRERWTEGGLAALLLVAQPSFVVLARSPLSEIVAAVLVLAGVLLLWRGGSARAASAGAALLGLAVGVRLSQVFALGFVWAGARKARAGIWPYLAWAAGVAPTALYQWATFGAPWRTGYGYWLADVGRPDVAFSVANIPMQLHGLWLEAAQLEQAATLAHTYGAGSYLGPASAALFVLAAGWGFWRPEARGFVLAGAAFTAAMLCYYFVDFRLFLSLVPLATTAAAAAVVALWGRTGSSAARAALVALTLAAVLGWPGRRSALETGDMIRTPSLGWPTAEWDLAERLRAEEIGDALVLTDLSPPYVHALLGGRTDVAPIDNAHDYSHNSASFAFGEPERSALIAEARLTGRAVWVLAVADLDSRLEQLGPATGPSLEWRVVERQGDGGLATLEAGY